MPALTLVHVGNSVDKENLLRQIERLLAGHLCEHTESRQRPCGGCRKLVEKLVYPVAKLSYRAALGNRREDPIGQQDGHASLGSAIDLLFKELTPVKDSFGNVGSSRD